jgi:hypothetical protein
LPKKVKSPLAARGAKCCMYASKQAYFLHKHIFMLDNCALTNLAM